MIPSKMALLWKELLLPAAGSKSFSVVFFLGHASFFLVLFSIALALSCFPGSLWREGRGRGEKADMFVMVAVYCVGSCSLRRRCALCLDT